MARIGLLKAGLVKPILFGLCLSLTLGGVILIAYDYGMHSRMVSTSREQGIMYPEIDESFSEARQVLLTQIRLEYGDPLDPVVYSGGAVEPWCANFVSYVAWLASSHGLSPAFTNPHSGSWRIPGVYTMREYFESRGEFYAVDSDYLPRPGDVVFYEGGTFGTHVNFVVWSDAGEDRFLDNDQIYTVGGNENGKILLSKLVYRYEKYGVVGFGRIAE